MLIGLLRYAQVIEKHQNCLLNTAGLSTTWICAAGLILLGNFQVLLCIHNKSVFSEHSEHMLFKIVLLAPDFDFEHNDVMAANPPVQSRMNVFHRSKTFCNVLLSGKTSHMCTSAKALRHKHKKT